MTGIRNRFRVISLTKISKALTPVIQRGLIGFHCFTGCDSTSSFFGKGKKKSFEVAKNFMDALATLGDDYEFNMELFQSLQSFVCKLYGQKTDCVNEARYTKFCSTSSSSEQHLPPTRDALLQHCKRVSYQAGIYKRARLQYNFAPSPAGHGWKLTGDDLTITWMVKKPAPDEVLVTIQCGCKMKCSSRKCSCVAANLKCKDLCKCDNCENNKQDEMEEDVDDIVCDSDDVFLCN